MGGGTTQDDLLYPNAGGLSPRGRGNLNHPHVPGELPGSIPAWAGEPIQAEPGRPIIGVYPRVGGGTWGGQRRPTPPKGLSPRGRGNRLPPQSGVKGSRSIPAWAGEPPPQPTRPQSRRVYPRVGGGTLHILKPRWMYQGLSPRGRGNRMIVTEPTDLNRSIPAWAGEPAIAPVSATAKRVYPRVGGGTQPVLAASAFSSGLSPRGRGNPERSFGRFGLLRSIPAWAGEPGRWLARNIFTAVYPRVGGGTGHCKMPPM